MSQLLYNNSQSSFLIVNVQCLNFSISMANDIFIKDLFDLLFIKQINELALLFSMEINQDIYHSSKMNYYSQENAVPILKGSCHRNDFSKIIDIQKLLEQPNYYLLILPQEIKFNQFVIVKESKESEDSVYHLYYQPTSKHLLSAKKQKNCIGCNYIFSKKKTPRKDEGYVGKLRGNFMNKQFNLYDNGNNPDKNREPFRNHLGSIQLKNNIFSTETKISVYLPRPQDLNNQFYYTESNQKNNSKYYFPIKLQQNKTNDNVLKNLFKNNTNKVELLKKREFTQKNLDQIQPQFFSVDSENKKISSVLETGLKKACLMIGQRTQRTYFLYASSPLSILQSFAYFLSILQSSNSYI